MDLDSGLSEFAVAQRRLVHGWNEFVTDNTEPVWKKYLDQVRAGHPSLWSLRALARKGGPSIHSLNIDPGCPWTGCTWGVG